MQLSDLMELDYVPAGWSLEQIMTHVEKLSRVYDTALRKYQDTVNPSLIFDNTEKLFNRIWFFNEEITKRCMCASPDYGTALDGPCYHIRFSTRSL